MCVKEIAWCLSVQVYYLVGAAKALVGGSICGIITAACDLVVAVGLIPHDIWFTYKTAWQTRFLGPNLKALVLLLLPVPLLCWPVVATIGGFLHGFFVAGVPLLVGGDEHNDSCDPGPLKWVTLPWSGIRRAVTGTTKAIREFALFNANSYFSYLEALRNHPGPAIDISFPRLLASLGVAVLGGVFGLLGSVVQLPKVPLLLLRGWWVLLEGYFKEDCVQMILLFIPWCLAMALLPVGIALLMVLLPVSSLSIGFMWAGIKGYQCTSTAGMAVYGLCHVWNMMHNLESGLNEAIKCSCCPVFFAKVEIVDVSEAMREHDIITKGQAEYVAPVQVQIAITVDESGQDVVQVKLHEQPRPTWDDHGNWVGGQSQQQQQQQLGLIEKAVASRGDAEEGKREGGDSSGSSAPTGAVVDHVVVVGQEDDGEVEARQQHSNSTSKA